MAKKRREKDEPQEQDNSGPKFREEKKPKFDRKVIVHQPLGNPGWNRKVAWIAGIILIVVLIAHFHGTSAPKLSGFVHVFPAEDLPTMPDTYKQVADATTIISLSHPFYTPDSLGGVHLMKGDIVMFRTSRVGKCVWSQGPSSPVEITADGVENRPMDLPSLRKKGEFALQSAPMGSLIGQIGTLTYASNGEMHVAGSEHFAIGTMRWIRIDGDVPKDATVNYALNLRRRENSWLYNSGYFAISAYVWRNSSAVSK